MKIIPAIDLIDGKCVRLSQGNYDLKTEYTTSPVEMAKQFEAVGVQRLHLVDLDGAKAGHPKNLSILEAITKVTKLHVDFSGGIRTEEDVDQVFSAGATYIAVGSAAVKNPQQVKRWIEKIGAQKVIIGADIRGRNIAISGWTEDTDIAIYNFITEWTSVGIKTFLCTAIEMDGLLQGPDFSLYQELQYRFPASIFIAGGGVSSISDLARLQEQNTQEVIIGKAIYEGRITLDALTEFLC